MSLRWTKPRRLTLAGAYSSELRRGTTVLARVQQDDPRWLYCVGGRVSPAEFASIEEAQAAAAARLCRGGA